MSKSRGPAQGFIPIEVHSRNATFAGTKFDNRFINFERRTCGIILVDASILKSLGSSFGAPGFDLLGNPMGGTAILIDYNFVLMCNHSFKSLMLSAGSSAMAAGKVTIVFNNEVTKASVDTQLPIAETNRPFAKLRGDQLAWTGTDDSECNEDFAIVKIEWNGKDFHKIHKSARLPDPSFNSTSLKGSKICTLMQYSSRRPVRGMNKTGFSNHVAMGTVTEINQSPPDNFCTKKKDYYAYAEHTAVQGSSGSGVYNDNGELVGILCGGGVLNQKSQIYFLPLDYIYKCKQKSNGIEAGEHLKNIYKTNKPGWP